MDTVVLILDILVCIAIALGIYYMVRDMRKHKDQTMAELKVGGWAKTIKVIIISTVFLFLDMFGIGSYGPHMACWKIFKVTRDEWIPGTLNVCMLTATLVETLYLVNNVNVEMTTLIPCIIAATLGSWLGGGIVVKLNVSKIRLAVGIALAIVGIVLILQPLFQIIRNVSQISKKFQNIFYLRFLRCFLPSQPYIMLKCHILLLHLRRYLHLVHKTMYFPDGFVPHILLFQCSFLISHFPPSKLKRIYIKGTLSTYFSFVRDYIRRGNPPGGNSVWPDGQRNQ